MAEINIYKVTGVPAEPIAHAWYLVKQGADPYFTLRVGDAAGTLYPLSVDVLGTILAGFSPGANTSITSSMNIGQAFAVTQGQINNLISAVAGGIRVPEPLDASGNPDYPAALKGDSYIITADGRIGGALGPEVKAGDVVNARADNPGGTHAAVGASWYILETNQSEASDTVMGYVRRATIAEVNAGTDVNAYVSSGRLRAGVRNTTLDGLSVGVATPVVAGDSIINMAGKFQAQINNRVVANSSITAGTRTKITYDSKGLVTAGADLDASDIPALAISKITGLQSELEGKVSGSGTAGQIAYWNGSGSITGGSGLRWSSNSLRVGLNYKVKSFELATEEDRVILLSLWDVTVQTSVTVHATGSGARAEQVIQIVADSRINSCDFSVLSNTDSINVFQFSRVTYGGQDYLAFQIKRSGGGTYNPVRYSVTGIFDDLLDIVDFPQVTVVSDIDTSPAGTHTASANQIFKKSISVGGTLSYNASNGVGDFATIDASNILRRRTPAQVRADIGALGAGDLSGYVPTSRSIGSGTGLTGGGNLSADRTLALTGQALAFHNLGTNGFAVRTASGTVAARTITGSDSIDVVNGNGVGGNPEIKMKYANVQW